MKTIPDDGLDIAPVPLRGHAVIAFAQKVDRDPVVRDQPKRGRPRSEPPPLPTSGALAGLLDALDREMAEIDRLLARPCTPTKKPIPISRASRLCPQAEASFYDRSPFVWRAVRPE